MKKIFAFFLILSMLILLAGCATTFYKAAERGDIKTVTDMLNKGVDVNSKTPGTGYYSLTGLHGAAWFGHPDIVKLLIEKGADVNARNDFGETPLYFATSTAITHGGVWGDIVKLLIDKGADIDVVIVGLERCNSVLTPTFYEGRDANCKSGIKLLEKFKPKQEIASQPQPSQSITKEELKTIVQSAVEGTIQAQKQETKATPSIQSDIDKPSFHPSQQVMGDNDLAVIIGIEGYQSLPKSDYSYDDARLMADYIKALGFKSRNIELLTDEKATKSSIEKSLEAWLKNKIKPDSRVFVYYSGHGAPDPSTGEAYLVPYDGDPNYLEVTGYSLKRLYDNLGKLQVAEVTVVLDSCFSGAGGRSVLAKGARPLVMMTTSTVLPSNMAVLSATQGTQISTSSTEKGHGVFTYYFLKALKEGKKTIAEIYEYIKPLVEDEAKQLNVQQSPSISPDVEKLNEKFLFKK